MTKCYRVKDITANKEYPSMYNMLRELGLCKTAAKPGTFHVRDNILKNNYTYKKSNYSNRNVCLDAIDGHKFEFTEYIKEKKQANKPQVDNHMRYTSRPRKADATNYADGDKVNTRMLITKFRFIKDDLDLDINTNDIAVVCETTGMIYPSIRKCINMIGYDLNDEQKEVLYFYVRKSCRTKKVVVVEKNRNNSTSYMSKYEGMQFKYFTDFGCKDFTQLKRNYRKALNNNLEEAQAEQKRATKTLIQLHCEVSGMEEVKRMADARVAMYTNLLAKK